MGLTRAAACYPCRKEKAPKTLSHDLGSACDCQGLYWIGEQGTSPAFSPVPWTRAAKSKVSRTVSSAICRSTCVQHMINHNCARLSSTSWLTLSTGRLRCFWDYAGRLVSTNTLLPVQAESCCLQYTSTAILHKPMCKACSTCQSIVDGRCGIRWRHAQACLDFSSMEVAGVFENTDTPGPRMLRCAAGRNC